MILVLLFSKQPQNNAEIKCALFQKKEEKKKRKKARERLECDVTAPRLYKALLRILTADADLVVWLSECFDH